MQTLTQLMELSGAQYRIYDMGRAVRKLDRDTFRKFEAAEIPYPYPFQGQALFSLLFWSPEKEQEHQIWFIKFPLDEQGLLKQACRDDFLKRTLEEVAQQQNTANDATSQTPPSDNPWGFTPHQDKMATIHAKASLAMGLSASQFYPAVKTFIEAPSDNWQNLGVQGIADFCARLHEPGLNENSNEANLIKALPKLPQPLLLQLLPQLENELISYHLADAIVNSTNELDSPQLMSTAIRALSQARGNRLKPFIEACLNSPHHTSVEVLVAISGRAWDVLEDNDLALNYLEALAKNDAGQQGFNHILRDLLYIPSIGPSIRNAFRSESRSELLIATLGEFLKNVH